MIASFVHEFSTSLTPLLSDSVHLYLGVYPGMVEVAIFTLTGTHTGWNIDDDTGCVGVE